MKNRNTLVAILAGVLAGTVIGAGTYYSAEVISYRYESRPTFQIQHRATDNRPNSVPRTIDPKHRAASGEMEIYKDCERFSGKRRANCIGAAQDGINEFSGRHFD